MESIANLKRCCQISVRSGNGKRHTANWITPAQPRLSLFNSVVLLSHTHSIWSPAQGFQHLVIKVAIPVTPLLLQVAVLRHA